MLRGHPFPMETCLVSSTEPLKGLHSFANVMCKSTYFCSILFNLLRQKSVYLIHKGENFIVITPIRLRFLYGREGIVCLLKISSLSTKNVKTKQQLKHEVFRFSRRNINIVKKTESLFSIARNLAFISPSVAKG